MDKIGSTISVNTIKSKIDRLRSQLGCPISENDPNGSDFWYLRLGDDEETAAETRPIAVKFYDELNILSNEEIRRWLTEEERQQEIYTNHYINRVSENQPAMYLLYPTSEDSGRVAFILPQEGGIKQRHIQTFDLVEDRELDTRLNRFKEVPISQNIQCSVPLVERIFYNPIKTSKELAQKLAASARVIEELIPKLYQKEAKNGYLHKLLADFQQELLPNLQVKPDNDKDYSFADIYAQTVAYALFTARVFGHIKDKKEGNLKETHFDRESAWQQLPETNPFLRKLFKDISNQKAEDLGDDLIGAIADIFAILRAAKMEVILQDFQQQANRDDIITHFYEPFLAAYKPEMRKKLGVYYTPEPVVSYMVRSVDILLKDKFNKPLGLADPEVMILDPATGTGTFLLWICQLIHNRFHNEREAMIARVGDISWSEYVSNHLLPRIFGFELLMAPYAIAHLKLGLFLQETGYQFDSGQRLGVYLTNTLEDSARKAEMIFQDFIAEEADLATEIKRDKPIMVAIGNPPYSGISANMSEKMSKMVDAYKIVDGKPLGERKTWLQDDYVKFIRFAQCKIEETGHGILGFICPHGYLDGPTFRGMRQSLMNTFDEVQVIDLHGNVNKREIAEDGSKDENVFDIQQGVAIGLFTRNVEESKYNSSSVYHSSVLGLRNIKYKWLFDRDTSTSESIKLQPNSPFYMFVPRDERFRGEYEQYWKITDIMTVSSTGITTARDHFVFDLDRDELIRRIAEFANRNISDLEIRAKYFKGKGSVKYPNGDTRGWKLSNARKKVQSDRDWDKHLIKCLYRPFDNRFLYYTEWMVDWGRSDVMRNMLIDDNLALVTSRMTKGENFQHAQVTQNIAEVICMSSKTSNNGFVFPLYLYPTTQVELDMEMSRRANLSPEFLTQIEQNLGYQPTPEAIFYYIYAIFHSPTYRSRYAELLKDNFPRVPLTSDRKLFDRLATCGERLVNLHLMKSVETGRGGDWESGGDRPAEVGSLKYESGKVTINKQGDGFIDVPEAVWNFHVGGYQVCQKWLKDRKGRVLSAEDIAHYQGIVAALGETIEVMDAIDAAIPNWPLV